MTTTLTAEIDVEAPINAVYNQWTQFESFPEYLGAVKQVKQIDDVRTQWTVSIAGKEESFYADIVDQVPDSHVAWQSTDGAFHAGRVEFEPHGDETHVKLRMEWEPQGAIEKIGAAVGIDDAQAQMDLQRFKKFMEKRGAETGGWRGEIHGRQETSPDA
ncbi:SRPBCC family protein [Microbacterium sp. NPDC096154]|uniref:SRPBCC family protein n=1 Tax=Microbacterium sp. NPDC096154 TaxID=3155549 RepID=UPI0033330465